MGWAVEFRTVDADSSMLGTALQSALNSTRLLAMALMEKGKPWINNAYFAYDNNLNLYVLTPPSTRHAQALEASPFVAAAITDTQQTGDGGKLGLQCTGLWSLADAEFLDQGLAVYRERFPATESALQSLKTMIDSGMESRLFRIEIASIRLFDEKTFGNEVWIDADVIRRSD